MKVISLATAAGTAALLATTATTAFATNTINTGTYRILGYIHTATANGGPEGTDCNGQGVGATPQGSIAWPGFNATGAYQDIFLNFSLPGTFTGALLADSALKGKTPANYGALSSPPGWSGTTINTTFPPEFPIQTGHYAFILNEGANANEWYGNSTTLFIDSSGNTCIVAANIIAASSSNSK